MLRRTLMKAAVAVAIAVACGGAAIDAYSGATPDPCTLLTADDVAAVLGGPATPEGSSETCNYSANGGGVELIVTGGRAEFDQTVKSGEQSGMPYTPLSGVGDKAYLNTHCGDSCAQVYVLKGGRFFMINVQQSPNDAKSATALARKVASRMH